MEKVRQLINNTMLEHLPGIYNMMTDFNMLVFGFVASQPVFCIMAINSIQKTAGVSRKVNMAQAKRWLLHVFYPGYYTLIASMVIMVWIMNAFTGISLFVAALLVLLVVSSRIYSSRKLTLPA